ncbi:MAG: DUF370 domain-containing protein [Ruminiclostridium sp.]|nr:DUF370 domain-containing protein [Ruminiclostridium sp.]
MKLLDAGYGNRVNSDRIVAVIGADSAPAKRLVAAAKEKFMAVDATCGKKTRTVIVTDSGHIIMSAKETEFFNRQAEADGED